MKGSKFTEEQIAFALKQAESGIPLAEVCRKMGVPENTFYGWKKKFSGEGVFHLLSPAKNLTAFFKTSRSCITRSSSRFSC